ncbi:MAG: type II 3-dehydroquinate dehydratase [Acetobacter sp.]|uniref:type II 3-dehydroquinate dehydratase n=1 Tax=Acetobacter sp. TaxID=440 RepID=UPI0039E7C482
MFINGPNANLYGLTPGGVYGDQGFPAIKDACLAHATQLNLQLDFRQSNHEGIIIDWIQEARLTHQGLLINAAGLTYTSIAILDALLAFEGPIIECHMSNIWKREPFRHTSYISKAATGVVAGLGVDGYLLAISAINTLLSKSAK